MTSNNRTSGLCECEEQGTVSLRAGEACPNCGRRKVAAFSDVGELTTSLRFIPDQTSLASPLVAQLTNDATADSEVMVGQSLDHFTIAERLGSGGMGTVYRAKDESLQRDVAIKVIRRYEGEGCNSSDTNRLDCLLKEARAQARVNHPNVVHIYFVSRDEQLPYLAMELVQGKTLANRIAEHSLNYEEVVGIGLQVACALRESAKFEIVHGDIKPSNILLRANHAKLSDFGLAQRVSPGEAAVYSTSGTPNYMAPETCRGEPPTSRADMYSFGVMLFEMTFGRLPYKFKNNSILARIEAHQYDAPAFPEVWPKELPEAWRMFLEKLLQKRAEDRFVDWDTLIESMRALRPLRAIPAGRLQRAIAWGIDLVVLTIAVFFFNFAFEKSLAWILPMSKFVAISTIASGLLVPLLVTWWISRGRSSPGKALMQLRVVDRHGLQLNPKVRALRSIAPLLPIWLLPAFNRNEHAGLPDMVWMPLSLGIVIFLLLDAVFAMIRSEGRSLHDQLVDSRVVLMHYRGGE